MRPENFIDKALIGRHENICRLTLNRPTHANAYNEAMLSSLDAYLYEISERRTIRGLIISGSGDRVFCAGADREELVGRRAIDGIELHSRAVFDRLAELAIFTIACINGAAIGGGLELALACDIRVSSPNALFALPELGLGLIPAAGGLRRLPRVVGAGRAAEMILFDQQIDAVTAKEWGLITYWGADFESRALALAEKAAVLNSAAVRLAKKALAPKMSSLPRDLEAVSQALLYERKLQENTCSMDQGRPSTPAC